LYPEKKYIKEDLKNLLRQGVHQGEVFFLRLMFYIDHRLYPDMDPEKHVHLFLLDVDHEI